MALDKQNIPISFAQGIDTKSDQKQVIPGKLLELENGIFTKTGSINKRNGYDALSNISEDGTSITSGSALSTYNDELILFSNSRVYSRLESTDRWIDKGSANSLIASNNQVIRNSYQQSNPDFNINGNVEVYAWEDSRGGVRYSVIDHSTKAIIVSDASVSATASKPKILSFQNHIFILYLDSNAIKYRNVNKYLPTLLGTETTLFTDVDNTNSNYDAAVIGDRLFITYQNNSTSIVSFYLDSSYTVSSTVSQASTTAKCLTVFGDSSQNVWIAYHKSTNVCVIVLNYNLTSVLTETTVEAVSTNVIKNITGIQTASDITTVNILYEINASNTYNQYIRTNIVGIDGTVGTASDFKRSVGLASKLFSYNDNYYVNVAFSSTLQATYFTLDIDGNIVSKNNPNVGGGLRSNKLLAEVSEVSSGTFTFANLVKGFIESDNGRVFTLLGVNSTSLSFTSANTFISSTLANNLHIVGGILSMYDGISVTEHNFHLYPENLSSSTSGGGSVAAGTYQYIATYEWTDNVGNVHRSTTSVPLSVTTGSTGTITITVPTLRLTNKSGVRVVVYRTESNGSIFYRVSSISSPTLNSTSSDTVNFSDTLADSSIISNDPIYITGSVLDNSSVPSCSLLTTHNNRLFVAGLEDKNVLWYSKQISQGYPVEFSEFLTVRTDARGGYITALASMDDKLIIFKNDAIFLLVGDGPNALGQNNDFGSPQLISSDVGCSNPNSVVLVPNGLMFQTSKGLYLLDRSLQVSYVGAPVESYNSKTITSANLINDKNQVRFTTEDSSALVYDYLFNQWSTFTNHQSIDALVWDSNYCFLKSNGKVYRENSTSFKDGTTAIKLKLVTSWLGFDGLQGFQRVYRIILLGDYIGKHSLVMKLGYNFSPYYIQSSTIDTYSIIFKNTYGSDSPYGSEDVYGGEYTPYQFSWHLSRQKCESLRISIEDSQSTDFNEGYSISAITLEVGLKKGLQKLPNATTFGTE